jgi:hypothetical protein
MLLLPAAFLLSILSQQLDNPFIISLNYTADLLCM